MKTVSKYYVLYRPPMPGSVPREGLYRVECFDDRTEVEPGIRAWGFVEYIRELTEKEVSEYELKPAKEDQQ